MRRLVLAPLFGLLLGLPVATPVVAGAAGCSANNSSPGQLRVSASGYPGDAVTSYRFYVSGPEERTVYEGRDASYLSELLTGLLPGSYEWAYRITVDNGDGTFSSGVEVLARCTVYGSVATPKPVVTPAPTPQPTTQPTPKPTPSPTTTPAPTTPPVASAAPSATPSATSSTAAMAAADQPTQSTPPAATLEPKTESAPLVDLDLSKMGAVVAGGLIPLALLALLVLVRRRRSQTA